MPSQSLDLFTSDTPAASGPLAYNKAFEAWLANARALAQMRQSSTGVYEHMWSAWTAWAVGNGIRFESITAADLEAYLASRGGSDDLSPRYAWRLLRLVDRVLASHARSHGLVSTKPAADLMAARPDIRFANAHKAEELPDYLPAAEARQVVAYLSAIRPGRSTAIQAWQEIRDRSSVALMLGAGLTPGEVRALKTTDAVIDGGRASGVPWKLRVDGNGNAPARETPVSHWAGQLLRYWLTVRAEQNIPGSMMYPSTRSTGKPWSKMSQYLASKEVLQAAGIAVVEGGSFRLRHTFALRQLRRGKASADVARWLGVSQADVMSRYERVVSAPVDVA